MTPLEKLLANPLAFAEALGVKIVEADADCVRARMTARPDLCTLGGIAHGGAIMSFADTLGGALAFVGLPEGTGATTLESKTNFIGSARAGTTLLGACGMVHRRRRTHVLETRVETEDGKLVALVVQTLMTL